MRRIFLPLICLLVLGCRQSAPVKNDDRQGVFTEKLQMIVDSIYVSNPASVGIMVHVEAPSHGVSWSGSAGYADKAKESELKPDQPALIASSIKTYIAAAILRLQEEGKLDIEDSIGQYLSPKTAKLFGDDGYALDQIKVKHLLSHTSGIADYVNDDYLEFINENPTYRWTRDEQLALATKVGNPLSEPQGVFQYADVNYLLATEIIEQLMEQPFYIAMRELLKYEELNLHNTWFPTLEDKPVSAPDLGHQYWTMAEWGPNKIEINWDAHEHDISWDLYGGGGIATTMRELAQFSHHLFNGEIVENKEILALLITDVQTTDGVDKNYRLGISDARVKGFQCYGHGGFWGTIVFYIPQLDASIAVCVLERKDKMKSIRSVLNALTTALSNQLHAGEVIETKDYTLYKAKTTTSTLVLYPGGGTDAAYTKEEFDIVSLANANDIAVLMMNFNRHLWVDEETTKALAETLEKALEENNIDTKHTTIGGMSIGGNVALTLSDYLHEKGFEIAPKNVFIIDSPIDLYALYQSSMKDVANPGFDDERLVEARWVIDYFEREFGKDSLLGGIQKVSPFTSINNQHNISHLKNTKLRFYTEPDSLWWRENRQTDYEHTNAYIIQQNAAKLTANNWTAFELIETKNKGYRSNGERHPHSWAIVEMNDLMNWVVE